MSHIILADDHTLVRAALRVMIEGTTAHRVVAEARDNDEALAAALMHSPELLVLDLGLRGLPLLALIDSLKVRVPQMKILVLTGDGAATSARRALAAGAHGYVLKSDNADELMRAMQAVLAGESYLGGVRAGALDEAVLTQREHEVLKLAGEGLSGTEIAQRLGLSVGTARKHRENLMRKLNVHNTAQLTAVALRAGLLA
jgi:DNA-binding NarL/FixJ family response regulator